jgi:broad specificity phosphatase PhoE
MGKMMRNDPSYHPDRMSFWRPVNGESLEDVRVRAIRALQSVRSQYGSGDVVVVCHGAVIQTVRAHVKKDWSDTSVVSNCGIFLIEDSIHE